MASIASFILQVITLVMTIEYINACSCAMAHPQVHYCTSHYVIVARIKNSWTDKFLRHHSLKLNKVFKANEMAKAAIQKKVITTPLNDGLCGVQLQKDKTYLLAGRVVNDQLFVTICNYHEEWSNMTVKQKKAFRLLYNKGCNCKINACPWWRRSTCQKPPENACAWTTINEHEFDCQRLESVCMTQANGKCGWNLSFRYRQCLKHRQEEKERQWALEP